MSDSPHYDHQKNKSPAGGWESKDHAYADIPSSTALTNTHHRQSDDYIDRHAGYDGMRANVETYTSIDPNSGARRTYTRDAATGTQSQTYYYSSDNDPNFLRQQEGKGAGAKNAFRSQMFVYSSSSSATPAATATARERNAERGYRAHHMEKPTVTEVHDTEVEQTSFSSVPPSSQPPHHHHHHRDHGSSRKGSRGSAVPATRQPIVEEPDDDDDEAEYVSHGRGPHQPATDRDRHHRGPSYGRRPSWDRATALQPMVGLPDDGFGEFASMARQMHAMMGFGGLHAFTRDPFFSSGLGEGDIFSPFSASRGFHDPFLPPIRPQGPPPQHQQRDGDDFPGFPRSPFSLFRDDPFFNRPWGAFGF